MSEAAGKSFDCVEVMRRIRTELAEEMRCATTFEERLRWLRSIQYSDPLLQRLQQEALQQTLAPGGEGGEGGGVPHVDR